MNQLSFTLLDLCQLGDIEPYYNTVTKQLDNSQHEVHDLSDKLLVSSLEQFQHQYNDLVHRLGGDEMKVQTIKGTLFKEYSDLYKAKQVPSIEITEDNVHEAKVVLLNELRDVSKDGHKWKYSVFEVLPPYYLPAMMDGDAAQSFFDAIKEKRKLVDGTPELSWWTIKEIEKRYMAEHNKAAISNENSKQNEEAT